MAQAYDQRRQAPPGYSAPWNIPQPGVQRESPTPPRYRTSTRNSGWFPSFAGVNSYFATRFPRNSSSVTTADQQVPFTITTPVNNEHLGHAPEGWDPREIQWMKLDEAKTRYYTIDRGSTEWKQFYSAAKAYYGKEPTQTQLKSLWDQMMQASYDLNATAGIQQSPFAILNEMTGGAGVDGDEGPVTQVNVSTGTDTSTSSSTNTTVNITSESEAKALFETAARQLLGRAPTPKEQKQFLAHLNQAERDNPDVTQSDSTTTTSGTTTTTTSPAVAGAPPGEGDGVEGETNPTVTTATDTQSTSTSDTDTTTVNSGGLDRGQYATDWARSRDDYAEFQMATTYLDAFQRLMRGA